MSGQDSRLTNIAHSERLWLLHLPNGDTITRHSEPTAEMRAAEYVAIVEYVPASQHRGAVDALETVRELVAGVGDMPEGVEVQVSVRTLKAILDRTGGPS